MIPFPIPGQEPSPGPYLREIREENRIYAKAEALRILDQLKAADLQIIQSLPGFSSFCFSSFVI